MTKHLIWTLGWLVAFTLPAQAAVTITGISNYSKYYGPLPAPSGTGLIIFGGMAGPSTNCTDINAVCDSCFGLAIGDLVACNPARVHRLLRFVISFTSDKLAGVPILAKDDTNSPSRLTLTTDSPTGIVPQGSTGSAIITWDAICAALTAKDGSTSVSQCPDLVSDAGASGLSGKIRVGFDGGTADGKLDTNDDYATIDFVVQRRFGDNLAGKSYTDDDGSPYTGVYHFEAKAGDTKATIVNLKATTLPQLGDSYNGTNSSYATTATDVRIYYYETTDTAFDVSKFNNIGPRSDPGTGVLYQDLPISTTTVSGATTVEVSPASVTSLANSETSSPKSYYFRAGIVDQARNIGFFTAPVGTADASTDTYCNHTDRYKADPTYNQCHWARPGEVLGVLADNVNCFIATAAYGSPFAKNVVDFRAFRDRFLITNRLGEAFVDWYYEYSPKAAQWIADRPVIRTTVRIGLWPAWAFAYLSLHFGLWGATLIYIISMALFTLMALSAFRALQSLRRRA